MFGEQHGEEPKRRNDADEVAFLIDDRERRLSVTNGVPRGLFLVHSLPRILCQCRWFCYRHLDRGVRGPPFRRRDAAARPPHRACVLQTSVD
jgi:hypothetical protein